MALMEGVLKIGGVWKIRRRIPADCLADFGVKEAYTRSLGTSDRKLAIQLATPILKEIDDRIAAIRAGRATAIEPSTETVAFAPLDRARAFDLIARWRRSAIQGASEQAWSGLLPPLSNDEAVAASALRAQLRSNTEPAGFEERFAQVLAVPVAHPVLARRELRQAFLSAWTDVEDFIDDFRHDNFDGWPEEEEVAPVAAPVAATAKAGVTLIEAFDLWGKTKSLESKQRGYVERLSQYLGDPDIADVKPLDLDRFLTELKKWPNTKRDLSGVSFADAIAQAEKEPGYKTLAIRTVYVWVVTIKSLFDFAVSRDLIGKNPAANMMRKPSKEDSMVRVPYEAADLSVIFGAPLFTGNNGKGLRDIVGRDVIRDHKFWLPILAHFTGGRVEELASLYRDEVRKEDGVWVIDLTGRPLTGARRVKAAASRRIIPLHDDLIRLGFVRHAEVGEGPMVFPELDREGDKASSYFTKWWGRWCERAAKVKGEGIDDSTKTFHSFRHAWKRAARQSEVKEEIHDLISGHEGGNGVARSYGRGVDVHILKAAIDAISLRSLDF